MRPTAIFPHASADFLHATRLMSSFEESRSLLSSSADLDSCSCCPRRFTNQRAGPSAFRHTGLPIFPLRTSPRDTHLMGQMSKITQLGNIGTPSSDMEALAKRLATVRQSAVLAGGPAVAAGCRCPGSSAARWPAALRPPTAATAPICGGPRWHRHLR